MGRPEKPVDASGGAVAAFARDLRQLRGEAGNPTYRDMARPALFSASVLSSAASGCRLPTLQVTLAFVAACGGDRDLWERRWRLLSGTAGTHAGHTPHATVAETFTRRSLPRPAQLPQRPRGFVGRVPELHRLNTEASDRTTPVVVTGPMGVGKSEFALRYAHQLATEMTDGHLYADLRAADTATDADVLAGFLHSLGMTGADMPATPQQQAGLYRSLLAERRLVVLLDNVRDETQVRPLLGETQSSVTIMVSRTPLLGLRDVRRVRLDVLPREDSVAMIAAAAVGLRQSGQSGTYDCARLAELCGDLPTALDVAARKLLTRPDLDLHDLVARLKEPSALLDWLQIGDISVRESLTSAYRWLGKPAATLLNRLARRPQAEFRLPLTGHDDELVVELVDMGMLRFGEHSGTYRIDALVRAFLNERVAVRVSGTSVWENHAQARARCLSPVGHRCSPS